MKNKWKISFFTLITVNLIIIFTLAYYVGIFTTYSDEKSPTNATLQETHFKVISSKDDLNALITSYLVKKKQTKNIAYDIFLDDDIQLTGSIVAFGKEVSLHMNFAPQVTPNGDLILVEKSIKLGKLQLPDKKVLQYIQKYYDLPEWIIVQPEKKQVYVALTTLKLKNEIQMKANSFDLKRDDISFDILVLP
jgi:uncharacterized protein YpmS